MPDDAKPLSVSGWLMRGAIREDDHPTTDIAGCYKKSEHPQDDPYNEPDLTRPLNHFYDPVNDRPLSKLAGWVALGERAPHWALGSSDPFGAPDAANAQRNNHFTVFDAREAMFRALTGMNKAGQDTIGAGGTAPSSAEDKEAVRKAYWATTFRALGDVVHLIQDMAQPQHTRNDAHAGACGTIAQEVFTGHESAYELRVDSRALGAVPGNPLDYYAGYPKVMFNDYVSYFSTRHLDAFAARRGIADYSNREFLSVDTNIGSYRYSSPSNDRNDYIVKQLSDTKGVVTSYLESSVVDTRNPEQNANEVIMAHESLFKAYLDPGDNFPVDPYEYALNNDIYDAQADLLIPRAVAYSAGLIDYFFRGRMEISLPDEGVYAILDHAVESDIDDGFRKVRLKLKNTTPVIEDGQNSYPQEMAGGTLWAVVKFQRNGCYQPDLSGEPGLTSCDISANRGPEEIVVSSPIVISALSTAVPQSFSFDFAATPIPVNAVNVLLQVVYRGALGTESDAVVVATRDISEPTFVSFLSKGWLYNNFNCGGDTLGVADTRNTSITHGLRFGVLAEYPTLRVNVLQIDLKKWLQLTVYVNRHQYNPQTGVYDITYLNREPNMASNQYWGFIQHYALIYNADSELFTSVLDDLSPYPMTISY